MSDRLQLAITRLLGPLVRFLLRHGVSHGEFSDWAKQAYINETSKHFGLNGKPPSLSRIAIVTGINRKEVKRIRDLDDAVDTRLGNHNRAIRVITGWLQDPLYFNASKQPKSLTYGESNDPFNVLVKQYGGDVPAKAMLDELVRTGCADFENGKVSLKQQGYIPRDSESAMFDMYATSVSDLLNTLDANLHTNQSRFQMSVAYNKVTTLGRDRFKQVTREEAMQLLKQLDGLLATYDRDASPQIDGEGSHRVGLGIYWIEDSDDSLPEKPQ